uniref:Translocation associated membrane protein 2 n=1 Tax=Sus scrofa TaxID=9823 RepID=A0A8D2BME7_PIG
PLLAFPKAFGSFLCLWDPFLPQHIHTTCRLPTDSLWNQPLLRLPSSREGRGGGASLTPGPAPLSFHPESFHRLPVSLTRWPCVWSGVGTQCSAPPPPSPPVPPSPPFPPSQALPWPPSRAWEPCGHFSPSLWVTGPFVSSFQVKFFYLCQLAYWLHALPELYFQKVRKEEIPRQLQYICLYLVHIAGAYLLNLSRLGLVLLLLQYSTEFLFHTARLCHFADENNEKLFNAWAAVFGVTRLFILTLAVLAIGFGLARMENQAFDPEKGNFNTLLCRLCVLLLVCAAQAWLMWRFIHSQLRHWREYWSEQNAKRRVPTAPRLAARLIKRESGYHENGVVKAENGTSPRTKKLKSP